MDRCVCHVIYLVLVFWSSKLYCVRSEYANDNEILDEICCLLDMECCSMKSTDSPYLDESVAKEWLQIANKEIEDLSHQASLASWNYETNITDATAEKLADVTTQVFKYGGEMKEVANKFQYESFSYDVRRQFMFIMESSTMKDKHKLSRLKNLQSDMNEIYSTGKVCPTKDADCFQLEPDLVDMMANSRDYDVLLWAWKSWRDAVGVPIGKLYPEFVTLSNDGAKERGFPNLAEESLQTSYEMRNFDKLVEQLYEEILPLYEQLHAYVRNALHRYYGDDKVTNNGPIPAHLLGNMWAQQWSSIYDILVPYPNEPSIDVTSEMHNQKYTVLRMFKMADTFYQSLGLQPMSRAFWEKSMFVKPKDREVECHATAEDLNKDKDVRIKMCTEVNMYDFYTVHHEMGHCQYYLSYRRQPPIYRGGANPAFHEAIGDTIALSVNTPDHLHTVGLTKSPGTSKEEDINFLMRQALEKIALLPFALVVDKWRWTVFRGEVKPEKYNAKWWELREKYQGISPPIARSEKDFDPGAKYHIASGTPYIRYFVSTIIQFQFHEALCTAAGHTGPFHRCDVYGSKEAGNLLSEMMTMGRSRPWADAMEVITGQREIHTSAIRNYFQPLLLWLEETNKNNKVGW